MDMFGAKSIPTPVVGCVMWTPGMLNTVNCSSIEGMYLVMGFSKQILDSIEILVIKDYIIIIN